MKKVIIIIILILSICGIISFCILNNYATNKTLISDSTETENAIDDEPINKEIVIPLDHEEKNVSVNEETTPSKPEQTNSSNDKVIISENNETKENISTATTSKSASSGKSSTSLSQGKNVKQSTTASTTTIEKSTSNNSTSNKSTSTSSDNKSSTPIPTPSTSTPTPKKSEPIYCYEGGKKHLGGDGPYEHGYYNTWQQAWDALTVYMKDMSSGNYYIEQCMGCDKYYYYCRQD